VQIYETFRTFVAILRKKLQVLTVQASNTFGERQAKEFFRRTSWMLRLIISMFISFVWQSFSLRSRKLRKTAQKSPRQSLGDTPGSGKSVTNAHIDII
jgi:hypothetical protein